MVSVKKVVKNAGIYSIVQMLQKSIGFLLLPLYTSFLTSKDYGIMSVITSISGFLSIFYLFGLQGALSKFYYDYNEDKEKLKKFYGTIITTLIVISFVLTVFLVFTHKIILDKFIKGIPFYPYMFLGIMSVAFSTIFPMYQNKLQMQHNAKKYAVQNIIFFVINIFLNIVFVVILGFRAKGPILASFIVSLTTFSYAIIIFSKELEFGVDKRIAVKSIKYSTPLVPHTLSAWIMSVIDRILLNNMKNASAVGIYNIGCQFGNIISSFATAINQAYISWFFGVMKNGDKNDKDNIRKFGLLFISLYSVLAMWLSVAGPTILKIMVRGNFNGVDKVIPYIAFANVFNGVYYFFVSGLFYNEKSVKWIPIATALSAASNIILNILLIPKYSIIGAGIATLVSYFLVSVLVLFIDSIINYNSGINWNYIKIYFIAFSCMIISLLNNILSFNVVILNSIVISIFIAIFNRSSIYKFKNFVIKIKLKY